MATRCCIPLPAIAADFKPDVRVWLLRFLIPLGGHQKFLRRNGYQNQALADTLGLGESDDENEFDAKLAMGKLRKLYRLQEGQGDTAAVPAFLRANVERLAALVGLSDIDCRILEFTVLLNNDPLLDEAADFIGSVSSSKLFRVLSVVLALPESVIRAALGSQGTLARSGLVSVSHQGMPYLRGKLDLISETFADQILSSDTDPVALLKDVVKLGAPPQLVLADYAHIAPALALLRPYLRQVVASGSKGVNIFLHGPPGTGKTQLARVLAAELGSELFEIASENEEGDAVSASRRLRAFRFAQSFFAQRRALLVFDEAEDIFNDSDPFSGLQSTALNCKAWINRSLEDNPVPAFWLSNSIDGLDPAFVRRFDMLVEVKIPPRRQREQIIGALCAGLLGPEAIGRIAASESLAPAVVARANSVVQVIGDALDKGQAAAAVEQLIDMTLLAQGHRGIVRHDPNRLPEVYDPAFIRADADLAAVGMALVQSRSGRLCLYGPPGTGKTAYGRWLAEQLQVPLLMRRASDLLSKYVGENERNIARAFRDAEQEGAVLMIDEVDSFLQDRRGAQRNWEAALVNEMLSQMESFSGVFVASTNLMANLDPAALRRFDLKLKFDFMDAGQSVALLHRYCTTMAIAPPDAPSVRRVQALRTLTPGDFSVVVRQGRLRSIASGAAFVAALESECALKEGARAVIGFV